MSLVASGGKVFPTEDLQVAAQGRERGIRDCGWRD